MPEPGAPTPGDDAALLARAKTIFLSLRALSDAERERSLDAACAGHVELKLIVRSLLRGDDAPLPFETLAEDIRTAKEELDVTLADRDAAAQREVGTRIGRYRLLERIGEGGFGVVYLAEQEEPVRRKVALKIVKLGMDTRRIVARFEQERQALAVMNHPNVAHVFDGGTTATGRPYFVMEYVGGEPITDYCNAQRLTLRQRLELFIPVCDAVQHAHHKGLIHRDLKPSNILVTLDDGRAVPKVIDFGVAKALGHAAAGHTLFTDSGQIIGTPEYMSPEQAGMRESTVDTRSDVYSLGVVLYQLLAGELPFDPASLRSAGYAEIQRIIREVDPPKPSTRLNSLAAAKSTVIAVERNIAARQLAAELKNELDWIPLKALRKEPNQRYTTPADLARDIRNYLDGKPLEARPESTLYRARKFVRRNRRPVFAASLLLLTLVAGLIGTSVGFVNADRRRTEALAAEALATRKAYTAGMLSASSAIDAFQFPAARSFLDAAPERLRGWEWRMLNSRLDTSIRALSCSMPFHIAGTMYERFELFSHPDGRSFFTVEALNDPAAHQWDTATGKLLASFPRPRPGSDPLENQSVFVVSPDGQRLSAVSGLYVGSPRVTVDWWNLAGPQRERHAVLPVVPGLDGMVGMSPDGTRVLRREGDSIWAYDTDSLKPVVQGKLTQLAGWSGFSRDGSLFAATGEFGAVEVIDGRTLAPVAQLKGHGNMVLGLDFSTDNRLLGTASTDGTARIWNLGASPATSVVLQHSTSARNIRLSPDAATAATIATDRAIRVWDTATGELRGTYSTGALIPYPIMFMPDGRTIAGREDDGTVRFWDVTAESTVALRGHVAMVYAARLAPCAGVIISGGWDGWRNQPGALRFWDAATGEAIGHLGAPGDIAFSISVSPDGRTAAVNISGPRPDPTAAPNVRPFRIDTIDLRTGQVTHLPASEQGHITYNPAGTALAFVGNTVVRVLDAVTGNEIASRRLEKANAGASVAWSRDGRVIAAGLGPNPDGSTLAGHTMLLDARTLEPIRTLTSESTCALAFSPDGKRLATGGHDGILRVFDTATGEMLAAMSGHCEVIMSVTFSPDGSRIASGGLDKMIRIWDAATFDQVAAIGTHTSYVSDLDWDPAGERLISASGDHSVRIWEPVPIRTRVAARDARKAMLPKIESLVARLFDELTDPTAVADRLEADHSLDAVAKKTALQLVLKRGLAQDSPPQQRATGKE